MRNRVRSQTGQARYDSTARRILIPEFRLLSLKFLETLKEEHSQKLPNYEFNPADPNYAQNFPVLIQSNGEPWGIGNLYLTTKLQREIDYEPRTFRGIADHLLDYLRFLEEESLDYLHFPTNDRLKVTYRYRQRLIDFSSSGQLSSSTASARINAVINFYRGVVHWNLVDDIQIENVAFTEIKKYISVTTAHGTPKSLRINSHNLAIQSPKNQLQAEYINDGGTLRPLSFEEQSNMLDALLESPREYQLMLYFSLFTGARIQTVGTLRIRHLDGALDSSGHLRVPIGAGTQIDTKRGKRMTLLVPAWLVKDLRIYVNSKEAKKRRARSYYGDSAENYVFLSNSGAPYYTSKQEILERSRARTNEHDAAIFRTKSPITQDGGSLRKHIREMLLPRIRREIPNFQDFTFHELRATFGMNLLESQLRQLGEQGITAGLEYVRQRMGHANVKTTMQYLQYKSRLKWKQSIQHEFESKLFKHINTMTKMDANA